MPTPSVSVMMPVFNAGIFLRPAVESVLAQTMDDLELLIIDDGSTDGSVDYLVGLTDSRVRVLSNGANLGIPRTRNRALTEARGEFLAYLDHDNVAAPDRLARQLEFLRTHPDVGMVGSAIDNLAADGRFLSRVDLPSDHLGIRWGGLIDRGVRQTAMMVRRGLITEHGVAYDEAYTSNSDYDFTERLSRVMKAANLAEPLTAYHLHDRNHSRVHHAKFVESGNRISLAAIRHELPDFAITLPEVAALRAVILTYRGPGERLDLARTKRAWELYLDLFEAFREKHVQDPEGTTLQPLVPHA